MNSRIVFYAINSTFYINADYNGNIKEFLENKHIIPLILFYQEML